MIVKTLTLGNVIATNTYFYIDEKSKHGFLIDPADDADLLLQTIRRENWIIEKILLTHGHFDHIGAVADIHKETDIPYYIHRNGEKYLTDANYNLSTYLASEIYLPDAQYLSGGEIISLTAAPQISLEVLHTPGHTEDSVVYYDKQNALAFVGDTIFKGNIGATHFPGGDTAQIYQSIREKILSLPENTVLYSGHSEPTTVKAEKAWY